MNRRAHVRYELGSRRAVCEALESRTLLSGGDFDPTFNSNGRTQISLASQISLTANAVAVQSDGKVVVVGSSTDSSNGSSHKPRFTLARFNADGTLDGSFGAGSFGTGTGVVFTDLIGGNLGSSANAVAIQPDGKIVVAGSETDSYEPGFAIARYLPSGLLDTSFGYSNNGVESFRDFGDYTAYSSASSIALQNDGKIVVAGHAYRGIVVNSDDMAVIRLNTDGQLDGSFGDSGLKAVDFGDEEHANAVTIDYTGTAATNSNYGKIILAGAYGPDDGTSERFALARLTPSGNLDDTFSNSGLLISPFVSEYKYSEARGVVVQPTGKIVVVGEVGLAMSGNHNFGIIRLKPNGQGDSTFGPSNGQTEIDFGGNDGAKGVIIGRTGKLIVAGFSGGSLALACMDSEGILDPLFAGAGKEKLPVAATGGIAVSQGGTFVTAGGNGFATERFYDRGATVYIASEGSTAYESGQVPADFLVVRNELFPASTRVYYTISGTATAPGAIPRTIVDYSGIQASPIFHYVDIPANDTQSPLTFIAPIDDAFAEVDETVIITIVSVPGLCDVIAPASQTLVIVDNDRQIGGKVFNDSNANGALDAADSGQAGRTVYIDQNNNKAFDTGEPSAITNVNGQYAIGNLGTGSEIVREVPLAGERHTLPAPPADSYSINVAPGHSVDYVSFGNTSFATITGVIYYDANGNGVKDSSETYLSNWQLYVDANKNGVLDPGEPAATTNSSGAYSFNTLSAGTWRVRQVVQPGYYATAPLSNNYFDVAVVAAQSSTGHNFGDRVRSISGTVFNDLDKDGVKDANEAGIPNVIVWIDTNGTGALELISSPIGPYIPPDNWVQTDASGHYTLTNLSASTYIVNQAVAGNYIQSLPTGGAPRTVSLATTGVSNGNDFGVFKAAIANHVTSITGSVFNDLNANGTRDIANPTEPDNVGWIVWLDTNNNGKLDSGEKNQKTDGGGNFSFSNLTPNVTYHLRSELRTGWRRTTAAVFDVKLTSGQAVNERFGVTQTALISGTVFNDKNGNKTVQSGEAGLSGWTVYLDTNNNGKLDAGEVSVVTSATGAYAFSALTAGVTYHIRVVQKTKYTRTTPTSGVVTLKPVVGQVLSGNLFGEK